MLVVDANVVLVACTSRSGFALFKRHQLVAPPVLWSEVRSTLHRALWAGEASRDEAERWLARFEQAPVAQRTHRRLGREAWRVADELGWAKTYDAEYVALAHLLGCRLVTLDGRLLRGAGGDGVVIGPGEI